MANRTINTHTGLPNYNKLIPEQLFHGNINGDSIDDLVMLDMAYRLIMVPSTTAGSMRFIAPSKSNASADVVLDGDTSQEIDLHVALPGYLFPSHVWRGGAYLRTRTGFTGGSISAITGELGDTGDPNGLVTATSMFTAGYANTTAAAEYAERVESGFIPTLTLTSTGGNLNTITAGLAEIVIFYKLLPQ